MSTFKPTYDACFIAGARNFRDFRVSENSFVAFKMSLPELNDTANPSVNVTVHVRTTNMLGYSIGCLGLFEMTDSNWNASDSYETVDAKVGVSPLDFSVPVSDAACDGAADNPDITFTIPESVISRWKRNHVAQVSLAIAPYGEFEYDGYFVVGSNNTGNPIAITVTEGTTPTIEPVDIVVDPITLVPMSRAVISVDGEGTFGHDISELVVTVGGVNATVISGTDRTIRVVVPEIPDTVEGTVEVDVSANSGTVLNNEYRAHYDASSTHRNKIFTDPKRPGRENERVSHSAVYNRDLGFNNFVEITDENSIVQNIYNILLTRKGERLFNPEFGTTIEERVFSIMNEDDETSILQECFTAIRDYEPRVSVDYEESGVDIDYDVNTIRITIAVVLPNGNSEYIVLPFKTRGTVIK